LVGIVSPIKSSSLSPRSSHPSTHPPIHPSTHPTQHPTSPKPHLGPGASVNPSSWPDPVLLPLPSLSSPLEHKPAPGTHHLATCLLLPSHTPALQPWPSSPANSQPSSIQPTLPTRIVPSSTPSLLVSPHPSLPPPLGQCYLSPPPPFLRPPTALITHHNGDHTCDRVQPGRSPLGREPLVELEQHCRRPLQGRQEDRRGLVRRHL
jgi:hypothetical protein